MNKVELRTERRLQTLDYDGLDKTSGSNAGERIMQGELPRKVMYVHHGGGQGGGAVSLAGLINNLDVERFTPILACDFRKSKVEEFFSGTTAKLINLKINPFAHTAFTWRWYTLRGFVRLSWWFAFGYWQTKEALISAIRRERPALVHLNGLSLLAYAKCVNAQSVPVIQHVREPINEGIFGVRKRWLQYTAQHYARFVISICADNQRRFCGTIRHQAIIYDPVSIRNFNPSSESAFYSKFHVREGEYIVFFPGGSTFGIKGIVPFLKAIWVLKEKGVKLKCIIPGIDGDIGRRRGERREIEQLIRKYALSGLIVRAPFINNVEEYYSVSNVVVAPFIVPHFSLAVIEAGSMSRPVIGSRLPPIEEVLIDGRNGLLVAPDDHEDLARKIFYILQNPDEGKRLGMEGRKLYEARFTGGIHSANVMASYDAVLTGNAR